jgi:hypothetical protein
LATRLLFWKTAIARDSATLQYLDWALALVADDDDIRRIC